MMEEKQETSADIIAEIRARAKAWPEPSLVQYDERLADRLEAVLKREKAEIEAEALAAGGIVEAARHTPGNAAAMREACQKMRDLLMLRGDGMVRCVLTWDEFNESQKMLRAALSAPPRNCDVGDAADWEKRFAEECDKGHICSDCPVRHAKTRMAIEFDKGASCEFVWAQMPYEAQEGGKE